MPNTLKTHAYNFDVLTIGAATRDVFIQSKKFKSHRNELAPDGLDACFPLGTKIDLDSILFETGGGATNAAVTFARFGLKTACLARVGNDAGGREIRDRLAAEGVETSLVQTDKRERTGYSLILLSGNGQRAILVYRGATRHIDQKAINWKQIKPRWIYLTSLGGNEALLKEVFAQAKRLGTHFAWNPGNAEISLGYKKLSRWLVQTDILILNREEAAELADTAPRQIDHLIHRLGPVPRQAFIMTDGKNGAYFHSRGTTWFAPPLSGKRINTTGAGDAFGSAFTAAIIQTGNFEKSLRAGMLNALGVITHMGAKAGILKRFPSSAELARVKIRKTV